MSTERPLIRVKPSWLHQQILLLGHLLLLLLLWNWLHGLYWNWFLVGTLLSLGYALYQARLRRFTLGWQGEEISYQGSRYQLGPHSRVGFGFLWLQLLDEKAGIAQEMAHILLQMEKAYINTALEALSADSVKKLQGGAIATARAVSAGGEHEA